MGTKSGSAYRVVKRRMKAVMETLKWHVSEGRLPPAGDVGEFCASGRSMAAFAGKGNQDAGPFLEAVARMEEASSRGDVQAFAQALALARAAKKACHARHR